MTTKNVGIIGSGLAGVTLGMFLTKRGYRVTLLDKRGDPRFEAPTETRSLGLTLTKRGLDGLEVVGAAAQVKADSVPFTGRVFHGEDGSASPQIFCDAGNTLHYVNRAQLNATLHDHAMRAYDLDFRFHTKIESIDLDQAKVAVSGPNGGETLQFDAVFGTDGAYSRVRGAMQKRAGFSLMQEYCALANLETRLPKCPVLFTDMQTEHVWARGDVNILAFPNHGKTVTVVTQLPVEGPSSWPALQAAGRAEAYLTSRFPELASIIPALVASLAARAPEPMISIKCGRWYVGDRVCLLGDAAHAFYASAGQGANAAFEDCLILDGILDETKDDLGQAFRLFYERRKPATDALCDFMLAECRGEAPVQTGDARLRARLREQIRVAHPAIGHSLYSNIAFTHVPYHVAYARENAVRRAIDGLVATNATTFEPGAALAEFV
jgi:kynurenine 3-monooxygenase